MHFLLIRLSFASFLGATKGPVIPSRARSLELEPLQFLVRW